MNRVIILRVEKEGKRELLACRSNEEVIRVRCRFDGRKDRLLLGRFEVVRAGMTAFLGEGDTLLLAQRERLLRSEEDRDPREEVDSNHGAIYVL